MFTVSDQNNVYGILNNWCMCMHICKFACVVIICKCLQGLIRMMYTVSRHSAFPPFSESSVDVYKSTVPP